MINEITCPERPIRVPPFSRVPLDFEPIATRRLILRRPEPGDAAAIAAEANDRHLAEMTDLVPHPYSIDHARDFVEQGRGLPVFVALRWTDRALLGVCGLRPLEDENSFSLGFWLGEAHRGEGLGTEMAQALLDLAFGHFGASRVDVRCRVVNEASRRVIQKCGFRYVGTSMEMSLAAGRVADERYSMDRRSWRALTEWGRR